MSVVRIESLDDPQVAEYRNVQDADLRKAHGVFVAEGRIAVRRLVETPRYETRSVLVTPTALDALAGALDPLPSYVPIFLATQAVLDGVVGYAMHRGCLALGERCDEGPLASLLAEPGAASVLLAIEQLTNPDNVGVIFRNARAFGADGVVLCPRCCDPLYRKSIRVSMGAALEVPYARAARWPAVLGELHAAGYRVVALHPDQASRSIEDVVGEGAAGDRIVLLLGTEGAGLTQAALEAADIPVRIPMVPGVDSLNVGTAAGIALQRFTAQGMA